MKEYKEPIVEIIDLPAEDIITTSGDITRTGSDTEMPGSGNLLGGSFGGGANWQ